MKLMFILLRIHGLLPSDETLLTVCDVSIHFVLYLFGMAQSWVVHYLALLLAYLWITERLPWAVMTDIMCTNFICLIVIITNIILAINKFEIRAVVTEMRAAVRKRNIRQKFFRLTISKMFRTWISHDCPLIFVNQVSFIFRTKCWTHGETFVWTCPTNVLLES